LEIIVENYPQICAEWLLRGEGSMLKTAEKEPETGPKSDNNGVVEALQGIIMRQAEEIVSLRNKIREMEAPPEPSQNAITA